MIGFPLGSKVLGLGADGLPIYSNPYKSEQLRAVNRRFFKDGVFDGNALKVTISPTAGYTLATTRTVRVNVAAGAACADGAFGTLREATEIGTATVKEATASEPWIQQNFLVVVRLNKNNGDESIEVAIRALSYFTEPPFAWFPEVVRDDSTYELILANVRAKSTYANGKVSYEWYVSDYRLSEQYCGVASAIVDVDTEQFFDEMNSIIDNAKGELDTIQEELNAFIENAQDGLEAAIADTNEAQAKNNADQAANNAAAQGILVTILTEGEYDPDTLEPTVEGTVGKMYLVPFAAGDDDDGYVEYMYIDGKWERIGTTAQNLDPITTNDIDEIVDDDQTKTGTQTLNLTGLSYLWVKLKSTFARIFHEHSADDITSGTFGSARISDGAVTSGKIANGAVGTAKLADMAVTSAKIADSAITSAKISDGTIATDDLANGAVTSAKIADGTIATADLADGAVTLAKLNQGIRIKLQTKSVTGFSGNGNVSLGLSITNYIVLAAIWKANGTHTDVILTPYVASDKTWWVGARHNVQAWGTLPNSAGKIYVVYIDNFLNLSY